MNRFVLNKILPLIINVSHLTNVKHLIICALFLISCFKEDEKLSPQTNSIKDSLSTATIALTQDYKYQIFYSLSKNQSVKTVLKSDWDLAFESSETGLSLMLNTARFMKAANTGSVDFDNIKSWTAYNFYFDGASGVKDSMAVKGWFFISGADTTFSKNVFIIDLGIDEKGAALGFKKIIFETYKNNVYKFQYSNLDNSELKSFSISKDKLYNYVYFSFAGGGKQILIEPPKKNWDLLFTQYSTYLSLNGLPYPYLVTGVFINNYNTYAKKINNCDFDKLSLADTVALSPLRNVIGFDWKVYDRNNNKYTVLPGISYIIKSSDNTCYKLYFTRFYNDNGEKGFPSFKFIQL